MSREVRITIDDDEVFERMKHRKQELDLSWEEVLHRGLRRDGGAGGTNGGTGQASPGATSPHRGSGVDEGRSDLGGRGRSDSGGRGRSDSGGRGRSDSGTHGRPDAGDNRYGPDDGWRRQRSGHRHAGGDEYEDQWDRFADSVEAQVQNKVYNALRNTFGAAGIDVPEPPEPTGLDREMADLSNAEDAVLTFDFLDDDPAYRVPLRVNLETSVDGLDVEVVAVRQGKSVREMNHFDSEARLAVTKRLARGEPAVLRFDDGAEGYEVEPIIRWERDDAGRPTVTRVDIEAVRLGEDDVE